MMLGPMRNTGALLTELPSSIFPTKEDLMTPNIETIIRDHVTLSVRCEDRAAGFDHRVTLCQVEISLTQIFDRPVQGRHFFEAVIRENLDLGRPNRVSLLFPRRITRRTPPPTYGYRTRIITDGVEPSLHIDYKRSHLKQYFKEGRGLRTELTINNPNDFDFRKALDQLPAVRALG